MASILKVDTIQDQSGNNIINESADTITIGASGDTITIPSGATLSNSGTLGSGMGKVLQVVSATDSTQRTTTSTSYVTGGNTLSVAITPSSTSSKIYVIVRHYAYNNLTAGLYTIYRDATNLAGGTNYLANYDSDAGTTDGTIVYFFLDSPNTTSSITYQPYMRATSGTTRMGTTASIASITAWEIAG